jgi:hypothetical protein
MSVYVDPLYGAKNGQWCHMMADTPEELFEMANTIGLHRDWVQGSDRMGYFFLLRESKRIMAIANGAVEKDKVDLVWTPKDKVE